MMADTRDEQYKQLRERAERELRGYFCPLIRADCRGSTCIMANGDRCSLGWIAFIVDHFLDRYFEAEQDDQPCDFPPIPIHIVGEGPQEFHCSKCGATCDGEQWLERGSTRSYYCGTLCMAIDDPHDREAQDGNC